MITQIIQKHFFCVKDVRAIGKLIPRKFLCVISHHRKFPLEAPKLPPDFHKIIPTSKPSVTDVLCNCKIDSK